MLLLTAVDECTQAHDDMVPTCHFHTSLQDSVGGLGRTGSTVEFTILKSEDEDHLVHTPVYF